MSSPPNIYAHRGRYLLLKHHARHEGIPHHKLSQMKRVLHNPAPTADLPVCIIGAGMAGLYTAMIFESLGISYQIVDADTQQRIGGRLFTYHFNGGPYDYYDVGAMRFPDTPFMKRTFDLALNRNLPVKLIPYNMQVDNTFLFYNNRGIHSQETDAAGDPFGVAGYVNSNLTSPGAVHQQVVTVIAPFRKLFEPDSSGNPPNISEAMDTLFEKTNTYSMRSYMFQTTPLSPKDIHWCETLDKSTGWYDRALTETVIESLAFDWPGLDPSVNPWHCFDGGSSTLPQAMFKSLPESVQTNTQFNSPVTAISVDPHTGHMKISTNGTPSPQEYSAVISTVPLPRLSLVDLTGVNINDNYAQWSAIRVLQYGPSIKVGVKFSCPWWQTELDPPISGGGQSFSDLPLRTIVYPSYPQNPTPETVSSTLIASYCWTQDAERMGALINRDGTGQPELMDLVLRDLAAVHDVTVDWLKRFYNGEYFAWDWSRDPLTMGAFAFFGPGVYEDGDVYNQLLLPAANGKLFFAGEAASACHAWVAGALDSSWRAVDQYINLNERVLPPGTLDKFHELWGPTEYWNESSDEELVELNRKLMDRHLVIALREDGVRLPGES